MNLTIMSSSLRKLPGFIIRSAGVQTYQSISRRTFSTPSKWHGHWEPTDLKLEPDIPEFETLHIRMRGYDCSTLEAYAKYVHRVVKVIFDLECDAWPTPAKSTQIRTFHPQSVSVNQKYDLIKFDRTVSAENVPTTTVPILLQFIQKNCPEGLEVSLQEPDLEEEEFRYVPDYDVLELQSQKESLTTGKLKKKK